MSIPMHGKIDSFDYALYDMLNCLKVRCKQGHIVTRNGPCPEAVKTMPLGESTLVSQTRL